MSSVRYLLDEHIDSLYRTQLLKQEPALIIWHKDDTFRVSLP
jgi:hypothetical protein